VKSLASQVATASQKIESDIRDVQVTSLDVVNALGEIHRAITGVQLAVESTATAVEEQSSVTGTIASNMKNASSSVIDINKSLGEILQLVDAASSSAKEGKDTLASALAL
jgi:methyl-accepting chemotaxis protein